MIPQPKFTLIHQVGKVNKPKSDNNICIIDRYQTGSDAGELQMPTYSRQFMSNEMRNPTQLLTHFLGQNVGLYGSQN